LTLVGLESLPLGQAVDSHYTDNAIPAPVVRIVEMRKAYNTLGGNPEAKR
jgi:hypothetical protein